MSALPQVVVRPRRALPFFERHPWVFAGAIQQSPRDIAVGDEVALVTSDGEFIARGLWNNNSNIRVRLYSWDESQSLDREFWSARIDSAIALRQALTPRGQEVTTSAQRLIFSEADGLSGLTVDHYGSWLVMQITSAALDRQRSTIVELLQEKVQPRGIWLRTEKGIREAEGLDVNDGLISGEEPPRPIFLDEAGVQFGIDLQEGQKTGFYLDQRDNRAALCRYTPGHRVLDLFCYTGGFGITALKRGEAGSVLGVDASERALVTARANAELNGVANKATFEKGDAFKKLEELVAAGEKFDTVVVDPPKMTRHRAGVKKALRGYLSLNQLAVEVLRPGGILVTCSCSGLVSRDDFLQMLARVATMSNRAIQILEARGAAADHPVSVHCPENDYLKCFICRVG